MITVDESFLDERMGLLENVAGWSPRTLSKFEAFIRSADDYHLFKVDPLAYAKEKHIHEKEGCDLFLHATRLGLFDIHWGLVCPVCGDTVDSFASLRKVDTHFHCTLCEIDTVATLDDFIMVSFVVSPHVRKIIFHEPAKLNMSDYWQKYRFNRQWRANSSLFTDSLRAIQGVAAGAKEELNIELEAGVLKIFNLVEERMISVLVEEGCDSSQLSLSYLPNEPVVKQDCVAAGKVVMHFENHTSKNMVLAIANISTEICLTVKTEIEPFFTAKQLLNSQTFRSLFSSEVIMATEGIGIKDITLLFTDLKGSTAMYDRIGDLQAFSLVRQHFESLTKVVAHNNGAIVKTIGDAVMATFLTPLDGVKAALHMLKEIDAFNFSRGSPDLILKVGLHHGAAIAVTLNDRLDYFGQTVNIAARVQGLADEDEIYITKEVFDYEGVKESLSGFEVVAEQSMLKGIAEAVSVHKIYVQSGRAA